MEDFEGCHLFGDGIVSETSQRRRHSVVYRSSQIRALNPGADTFRSLCGKPAVSSDLLLPKHR
jgi:hypothetical protein